MRGGCSYLPQDDIFPPPAKDIIDNVKEELNKQGEMRCAHRLNFLMMKPGFQQFEWKLHMRIMIQ
jgi:hypothetical protein